MPKKELFEKHLKKQILNFYKYLFKLKITAMKNFKLEGGWFVFAFFVTIIVGMILVKIFLF